MKGNLLFLLSLLLLISAVSFAVYQWRTRDMMLSAWDNSMITSKYLYPGNSHFLEAYYINVYSGKIADFSLDPIQSKRQFELSNYFLGDKGGSDTITVDLPANYVDGSTKFVEYKDNAEPVVEDMSVNLGTFVKKDRHVFLEIGEDLRGSTKFIHSLTLFEFVQ